MTNKIITSTLLTLLLALPQLASAHFHYGLKVSAHLTANAQQQFEAVKMIWVYDDEVSQLMIKGETNKSLLAKKLLIDLENLQYFTTLKLNEQSLDTTKVTSYKLEEIMEKDKAQLKLTLTLPLKTPVSLKGKNTLEITHEDATASAIMYYKDSKDVIIDKTLNDNCRVDLTEKKEFEEGESPQQLKIVCGD